ncbi:MAG TPA: DUF362 domain-containing protein [Kiritimatiellia bacterium]|nr:DUF362 domain-containing protein [Kiritimatiellia bacterium]
MPISNTDVRHARRVAVSWTTPAYPAAAPYHPGTAYPEYTGPLSTEPNGVYEAVRTTLRDLGLDAARFGTPDWNPIGDLVKPGARVVIKPNWVLHANEGPGGTECLYTHPSVLRPLIDYALKANPSSLVIGDAPVQVCDFDALMQQGFEDVFAYLRSTGARISVKDFRRTISVRKPDTFKVSTELKPLDQYVRVDLGVDSLLEPISADHKMFRVTMYNPDLLPENHAPGRHRYLIAKDILEADLVINVPKLKTHMKAGVTLALKNLVGINGSKEFLPHHRKGAASRGGDNYEIFTLPKWLLENLLDWFNRRHLGNPRLYGRGVRLAYKLLWLDKIRGLPVNVEGGWHGNDTVWRMCLDLNKILLYADVHGCLHDSPRRVTLHLTDGVIAGDGEGPLRPDPVPMGAVIAAINAAAHDWAITRLMGFPPEAVPITRHAFIPDRHPLVDFSPEHVMMQPSGHPPGSYAFAPAAGWRALTQPPETRHAQT